MHNMLTNHTHAPFWNTATYEHTAPPNSLTLMWYLVQLMMVTLLSMTGEHAALFLRMVCFGNNINT